MRGIQNFPFPQQSDIHRGVGYSIEPIDTFEYVTRVKKEWFAQQPADAGGTFQSPSQSVKYKIPRERVALV